METILYYTIYYTILYYILYYTILYYTILYITLHYIAYITLHYITLHYITLHTLHYITLHYITLHCITLHYYTYKWLRHTFRAGHQDEGQDLMQHRELHAQQHADAVARHGPEDHQVELAEAQQPSALGPARRLAQEERGEGALRRRHT